MVSVARTNKEVITDRGEIYKEKDWYDEEGENIGDRIRNGERIPEL